MNKSDELPDQTQTGRAADEGDPLAVLHGLSQTGREKPATKMRVHDERAFVLTTYPWSESSLIAELLTEHHGRVPVVVRGAKRPYSKFRGLIQAFSLLKVTYSGAGEVKNLTNVSWAGMSEIVDPDNLMSAFYINELVLRMTMREDAMPSLFCVYRDTLNVLAQARGIALQVVLRRFEVALLEILGWGMRAKQELLDDTQTRWCVYGGELMPAKVFHSQKDDKTDSYGEPSEVPIADISGVSFSCAQAIVTGNIDEHSPLKEIRQVLREIIGYYVGDTGLKTRRTLAGWAEL